MDNKDRRLLESFNRLTEEELEQTFTEAEAIFAGSRREYEKTKAPEELGQVVRQAVAEGGGTMYNGDRNNSKKAAPNNRRNRKRRKGRSFGKLIAGAAAAVVVCFTLALNTSEVFAKAAGELALIGPIAQVLTFRSYEEEKEDYTLKAEIPQIEADEEQISEEAAGAVLDANEEIQKKVEEYSAQAEQHIQEYKDAFLATGGTEEEFAQKDIRVDVSYDVKSQTDAYVSFVITANENWSNAYGVQYFYNISLEDGRTLTLADVLGEDYIAKADAAIKEQMQEQMASDENTYYFTEEEGGFTTIGESPNFYINENGNPVIVFAKYEVAPGSMGTPEFEISK